MLVSGQQRNLSVNKIAAEGGGGLSLRGKKVQNATGNKRSRGRSVLTMVKTWARHKTEALLNNGWRLATVGGWWQLAVVGGWWLAVGGWWRLAISGWQWAAVGGGRLVVPRGCP